MLLNDLPIDIFDNIAMMFDIKSISTLQNFGCTNKDFNEVCENRAKNIVTKIKYYKRPFETDAVHMSNEPVEMSWIPHTQQLLLQMKHDIQNVANRLDHIPGKGILWVNAYYAVRAAHILDDQTFLVGYSGEIVNIILGQAYDNTYGIWERFKQKQDYQKYFEKTLFCIIDVAVEQLQTDNSSYFFTLLKNILNPYFRRFPYQPGLYETSNTKNDLYDRVVEHYLDAIKNKALFKGTSKMPCLSLNATEQVMRGYVQDYMDEVKNATTNKERISMFDELCRFFSQPCFPLWCNKKSSSLLKSVIKHKIDLFLNYNPDNIDQMVMRSSSKVPFWKITIFREKLSEDDIKSLLPIQDEGGIGNFAISP